MMLTGVLKQNPYTITCPYNARSDWLKQHALSENRALVNDGKLAFKP